jgi:hypothetical protein
MDETPTFLTEKRRDVLNGEFDGSDSSERTHKSLIRTRAKTALNELIAVADSGTIDNADVFDADQIYTLLAVLTTGRDTFGTSDPDDPHYREVDPDYRNDILRAMDRVRLEIHGNERWDNNE